MGQFQPGGFDAPTVGDARPIAANPLGPAANRARSPQAQQLQFVEHGDRQTESTVKTTISPVRMGHGWFLAEAGRPLSDTARGTASPAAFPILCRRSIGVAWFLFLFVFPA